MPFIESEGARLYYRLEGRDDRPVLLLSNSLGTDVGMWAPQLPGLMESHCVLLYDSRGHGASEAPDGDYSVAQLGRDALALADALGVGRFAFCGLSLGGLVGQWLGLNAAERLTALVLSNASPYLPPPEAWAQRMALVREKGMAALVDPVMERFFSEGYRRRDEPLFHSMRRTFLSTPAAGYAGCCAAVRDADFRARLAEIRVPTLVIGGSDDAATPPAEHARKLEAAIPGARYAELPAGHIANVEAPADFLALLRGFLAQP